MKNQLFIQASILTIFIFTICTLYSCSGGDDFETAKKNASKYHSWVAENKTDSILTLVTDDFFSETDTATFLGNLNQIQQFGTIVSSDYYGYSKEIKLHTATGKASYVTLKYRVKYSSGRILDEQFRFVTDDKYSSKLDILNVNEVDTSK